MKDFARRPLARATAAPRPSRAGQARETATLRPTANPVCCAGTTIVPRNWKCHPPMIVVTTPLELPKVMPYLLLDRGGGKILISPESGFLDEG